MHGRTKDSGLRTAKRLVLGARRERRSRARVPNAEADIGLLNVEAKVLKPKTKVLKPKTKVLKLKTGVPKARAWAPASGLLGTVPPLSRAAGNR
jgi:hypothetical protein